MMVTYALLAVLGIGGTIHRTGQWRARIMHAGYAIGFAAMGQLIVRWSFGLAVILGVVPWCVGFIWIFVDSFRP